MNVPPTPARDDVPCPRCGLPTPLIVEDGVIAPCDRCEDEMELDTDEGPLPGYMYDEINEYFNSVDDG